MTWNDLAKPMEKRGVEEAVAARAGSERGAEITEKQKRALKALNGSSTTWRTGARGCSSRRRASSRRSGTSWPRARSRGRTAREGRRGSPRRLAPSWKLRAFRVHLRTPVHFRARREV